MEFSGVITRALRAAREAVRRGDGKVVGRGAYGDITYDLDSLAEEAIERVVRENWPHATMISEEAGVRGSGVPYVLVDPLDGSANALRRVPIYSSAMAISKSPFFKDITASGVMDIVRDELFIAEKSQGCFVNGARAECSQVKNIHDSVICFDMKTAPRPAFPKRAIMNLFNTTKYPRCLGSAALEVAYVCSGRVDAFLEGRVHLRTFDCLPSIFLVREAGGYVKCFNVDLEGLDLRTRGRLAILAAGSKTLGEEIVSFLRKGNGG